MLEPGTQLDGRYQVIKLLGRGGMSSVFQVQHMGLQSVHALKVLNPDLALNEEVRARFLAEGRIQAKLRHPNIVQVTEIVTTPVAGLVMDYVEGMSLGEYCRSRPGFAWDSLSKLREVFLPVLDAVDEAHRHQIIHRDLKPDNIILGHDSRGRVQPKVTDFGIAKVIDPGAKTATRAGMRMGTLQYMSPEQVRGAENVDARSDVFSLGAILYEVLSGKVAFDAHSDFDTMKAITEGAFVPPERVMGGLPPELAASIRKALAVNPNERFQSCVEFSRALDSALSPTSQGGTPTRPPAVTGYPAPAFPGAGLGRPALATPPEPLPSQGAALPRLASRPLTAEIISPWTPSQPLASRGGGFGAPLAAPKRRVVYVLLALLLGALGLHNFYAGYTGRAVAQLLITVLTCGLGALVVVPWALIEMFEVTRDAEGNAFRS